MPTSLAARCADAALSSLCGSQGSCDCRARCTRAARDSPGYTRPTAPCDMCGSGRPSGRNNGRTRAAVDCPGVRTSHRCTASSAPPHATTPRRGPAAHECTWWLPCVAALEVPVSTSHSRTWGPGHDSVFSSTGAGPKALAHAQARCAAAAATLCHGVSVPGLDSTGLCECKRWHLCEWQMHPSMLHHGEPSKGLRSRHVQATARCAGTADAAAGARSGHGCS